MTSRRTCGDCTLCCKVMAVESIAKPKDTWCQHCDRAGGGCRIYDLRPQSCQDFACSWLAYPEVPDGLKPNRCKAVIVGMSGSFRGFVVHVDPGHPDAWRQGLLHEYIQRAVDIGLSVAVVCGSVRYWLTHNEDEVRRIKEAMPGSYEEKAGG